LSWELTDKPGCQDVLIGFAERRFHEFSIQLFMFG